MGSRVKPLSRRSGRRPATPRRYDASGRQAAARETRQAIASAARQLFVAHGYGGTTMAAVAAAANVSHETVYAAFGPKPALFRHLVETALSGTDEPVPALERESTRALQAEPDPARLLEQYAHVVRLLHERLAPLFDVLRDGARTDADLKALADELNMRRMGHMRALSADLASKGGLRPGLSVETAADMFWVLISPEFYLLWVRDRGCAPEAFELWLADAFKRLCLPQRASLE
jgi:AcrR family transcriptional regulator